MRGALSHRLPRSRYSWHLAVDNQRQRTIADVAPPQPDPPLNLDEVVEALVAAHTPCNSAAGSPFQLQETGPDDAAADFAGASWEDRGTQGYMEPTRCSR